ncbi:hypothetical protein HYDPIDRAFT_39912 [Hydnomerulius pinastri MD-312]|uniref:Rho-GAP domain-containing protein n=1 Tax=Hydnomerulius pinastri MD-312 TaxID=994086 RepID=A0A0C9WFD2_9AGAM|nr:hypothetical protein HYDPIDRAFT_39912 [Hydnomerulius pinastri MD-312]
MSSRQDDLLRLFLRPSENLRSILNVEAAAENASILPNIPTGRPELPEHSLNQVICVVTHKNEAQDCEEGSFIVFKSGPSGDALRVERALAITGDLTLSVAQARRETLVSRTSSVPPSNRASTVFVLTIKRGVHESLLTFVIPDTRKLQGFSAEFRRLREIATANHRDGSDYTWLDAYAPQPASRSLDLRLRMQPLSSRLSPASAGLPGDDTSDISTVRREWIEKSAAAKASAGYIKHLRIRIGSFNVNGKAPSQDLSPWLRNSAKESQAKAGWISPLKPLSPFDFPSDPLEEDSDSTGLPISSPAEASDAGEFDDADMLVLGFQELDLSTEALLYTATTLKEDAWLTAIFAALGEKGVLYEKLVSRQLVGMLLVVVVKKSLSPCFSDVRFCDAGAGIMGFMGNKGATAIRLDFAPTPLPDSKITACRPMSLTFVNAHLAAFDEMVDRRNYDFHELSGRLAFHPIGTNGNSVLNPAEANYNIYQSDMLFWMGGKILIATLAQWVVNNFSTDLNYRVDLPDADIRTLLSLHKSGIDCIPHLLAHDQLKATIETEKAFAGFIEHAITHLPTYRYASGISKDELGYDTKRKPAWTDRILHMSPPGMSLKQLTYRSHPEITMSDHQPISADFDVSFPVIDDTKYEKSLSELHRELSGFEDSGFMPKIKIQPAAIDLGNVIYKRPVRRKVVLQNDGNIPCVFRFVGTGADGPVSPSWLHIEPAVGLLRPGESTTIAVLAYVDNESAEKLNLNPTRLEYTLILHTALGKDHFIAVSGDYQYTCFANALGRLTRLAGPIRELKSPEELMPAGQATNAPREIMRLINWMMTNVLPTDDLFEVQAKESLCGVIRECLDTGDDFPSASPDEDHRGLVAAFATTLVSLLDSLTEPLVPPHLHTRCLQTKDRDEAFELLDEFPHECINVWISLTAFLHYVSQQDPSKDASPNAPGKACKLAMIFAPILLRDDPTGTYPRASPVGKRDFLLRFIS